jgi:hypothetical protein
MVIFSKDFKGGQGPHRSDNIACCQVARVGADGTGDRQLASAGLAGQLQ